MSHHERESKTSWNKAIEGKGNYTGRGKLQNYVSLVSPKELRREIVITKQEQGATERTFRRQKTALRN